MTTQFKMTIGVTDVNNESFSEDKTEVSASTLGYISIEKTDGSPMTEPEHSQALEHLSNGDWTVPPRLNQANSFTELTRDSLIEKLGQDKDPIDHLLSLLRGEVPLESLRSDLANQVD